MAARPADPTTRSSGRWERYGAAQHRGRSRFRRGATARRRSPQLHGGAFRPQLRRRAHPHRRRSRSVGARPQRASLHLRARHRVRERRVSAGERGGPQAAGARAGARRAAGPGGAADGHLAPAGRRVRSQPARRCATACDRNGGRTADRGSCGRAYRGGYGRKSRARPDETRPVPVASARGGLQHRRTGGWQARPWRR